MTEDPQDIVRAGYDAVSHLYRADDAPDAEYGPWLSDLDGRLPRRADVLDIGCGNGIPIARHLTAAGHRVTGADLSPVQIARARRLVPGATFLETDAARLELPARSLDAVVSFYALIHMPQDDQRRLLGRIATWLRPGGWFVATVGHRAWTGTEDHWLGGSAPMWWSHPDAAEYRRWLVDAGFAVDHEDFVPEGSGGHALFRAVTPP